MLRGKIHTKKLIHIVPFSYETDKDFKTVYDEINQMTVKSVGEERKMWKEHNVVNGEQDTFAYIVESFYSESDKHNNIASAWSYELYGREKVILSFELKVKEGFVVSAKISNLHLLLFQTGIGMIWYEVDTDETLDADEWMLFQNEFKELARGNGSKFFLCQYVEKRRELGSEEIYTSVPDSDAENYIKKDTKRYGTVFIANKSFPICDSDCVDVKHDVYPDTNVASGLMTKTTYILKTRTTMGEWLCENITSKLPYKVNFYPARKRTNDNKTFDMIPDKALLFNYVVFRGEEQEDDFRLDKAAYYLTNGYKDSYVMPADVNEQMFRPFGNAVWYAAKEGCGYYILADDSNIEFFSQNMKNKVMDDYFILYLLLLYQTYSVLHFANQIANEISANPMDYENRDNNEEYEMFIRENADKLSKLRTEINLFMLKSVYTSVSHIHHQNSFYQYVEKRLRIRDDLQSLTLGLESMEELLRVRKEKLEEEARAREIAEREAFNKTMNIGMTIISLISTFSVVNVIASIADRFPCISDECVQKIFYFSFIVPIGALGLLFVGFCKNKICNASKKKKVKKVKKKK